MTPDAEAIAAALLTILRRTHLSPPSEIADVFAEEAQAMGVADLAVYLIDYEQRVLMPVPAGTARGREAQPVRGTVAGRAYAATSTVDVEGDAPGQRRVWLPLLDGTERLGVVEAVVPADGPIGEETQAVLERFSHFVALIVAGKGAYSDLFDRLRRTEPMTMAGELLWELVPPLVLATDDFVLGALLEPCYDLGGDAFDYALNEGVLHVAVFDGMGHGLAAAGVTAFGLSAYRHCRRRGMGPAETYAAVDAALAEQYPTSTRFVTALLAELDVRTGMLNWVSAGHPAPLLLRGGRLVKTLDVAPAAPLGTQLTAAPPVVGTESLEPGDSLLLFTDGLTEARRPDGALFTVERLGGFIEREAASGQAAPETLRRLREAIIERQEGVLHDDATAVLVEWRRGTQEAILPGTV